MASSCPPDIMGGQSNIIMEVTVMNKYVSLDKGSKKALDITTYTHYTTYT